MNVATSWWNERIETSESYTNIFSGDMVAQNQWVRYGSHCHARLCMTCADIGCRTPSDGEALDKYSLPFIPTFLTQSLYDIFWLDNSKGIWDRYLWNHDVVKAEGLVAFDARQVNVSQMMEFMFAFFQLASAQAIFLFAGAIINMVKDVVFCKQGQCTIDRRFGLSRYSPWMT